MKKKPQMFWERRKCNLKEGELCNGLRKAIEHKLIIFVEPDKALYLIQGEELSFEEFEKRKREKDVFTSDFLFKETFPYLRCVILDEKLTHCPFCGERINLLPKRCQSCHKKTKMIAYWNEVLMESGDHLLCLCAKCIEGIYKCASDDAETWRICEEERRKEFMDEE
jgi:hypothetical protein